MSSISNFRNYIFTEANNQLVISKAEERNSSDFLTLVQSQPCYKIVPDYSNYLQEKLGDLEAFHPTFNSQEAQDVFCHWREEQRIKIGKKLVSPLETLREKVAKRFEQLFQEKGERRVILGCCHVKNGPLIQTHTPLIAPLPQQTDGVKETHSHDKAICIDWRVNPTEAMGYEIAGASFVDSSSSSFTLNAPDFSRRLFEDPESIRDFGWVRNVEHFHAERVPFLERGVCGLVEEGNIFFLQQILDSLAPGGVYSFDVGLQIPLILQAGEQISDFADLCEDFATKNFSGDFEGRLNQKLEEVNHDLSFLKVLDSALSEGHITAEAPATDLRSALILKEAKRRLEDEVVKEFFDKQREKAKQFTKDHREMALLDAENINIFCTDGSGSNFTISLSEVQQGLAQQIIEECSQRTDFSRLEALKVFIDPQGLSFGQLFAIYRQLECYCALHVQPELQEELLPENKDLLDEMLEVWVEIMGGQLETIGFVNANFVLDCIHPDNDRRYSRILSVEKPLEEEEVNS
jgi:hypothetical protein